MYTYRSILNEPSIVEDFNTLKFAEAELTLVSTLEGKLTGLLSWPTKEDDSERAFMTLDGELVSRDPALIRLHGVGTKGSDTETFDYGYEVTLAKRWPQTTKGRTCLLGSVIRLQDHGNAKAGKTASVTAVQRDFLEPRDITGVALALPRLPCSQANGTDFGMRHGTRFVVNGQISNTKGPEPQSPDLAGRSFVRPERNVKMGAP